MITNRLQKITLAEESFSFGKQLDLAKAHLRPASIVMSSEGLQAIKASSLSFGATLVEHMTNERWQICLTHRDVNASGAGMIIYEVKIGERIFSVRVGSTGLDKKEKDGRLRDLLFDFHCAIHVGTPSVYTLQQELEDQISKVWQGRAKSSALGWSFFNRSNRLYDDVIDKLVAQEPLHPFFLVGGGGYLVRNAGFYGNGRHGSISWESLEPGHPFSRPYHLDLFVLYMQRIAGFDFLELTAQQRNSAATKIPTHLKRYLGIGNASGAGMIGILAKNPQWLNAIIYPRELAIAFLRTQSLMTTEAIVRFRKLLIRGACYYTEVDAHIKPRTQVGEELQNVLLILNKHYEYIYSNWSNFLDEVTCLMCRDTLEQVHSLLINTYPKLVAALRPVVESSMKDKPAFKPEMPVFDLQILVEQSYGWALKTHRVAPEKNWYFWYRSEENGENRRGERAIDPGVEIETFVDLIGAAQTLYEKLKHAPRNQSTARFLLDFPEQAFFVERLQFLANKPYADYNINVTSLDFKPSQIICAYLTAFGLEIANPNSVNWVRGTLLQGAPLPEDIAAGRQIDWSMPSIPDGNELGSGY